MARFPMPLAICDIGDVLPCWFSTRDIRGTRPAAVAIAGMGGGVASARACPKVDRAGG